MDAVITEGETAHEHMFKLKIVHSDLPRFGGDGNFSGDFF